MLSENRFLQGGTDTGKEHQVFDILGETFFKPNDIWRKRLSHNISLLSETEVGYKDLLNMIQEITSHAVFPWDRHRATEFQGKLGFLQIGIFESNSRQGRNRGEVSWTHTSSSQRMPISGGEARPMRAA